MRARDPFELPFQKLAKLIDLRKHYNSVIPLLVDRFLLLSAHEKSLTKIVSSIYPLDFEYSAVVDKALDFFSYSLDEAESHSHLTPYHLSFFMPYFSAVKTKGQFFTPAYLSDYLAGQIIELYEKLHSPFTKSSFLDFASLSFADIACGTGNLLIALLAHLRHFFLSNKNPEEFITFASSNFYGFELDSLPLFISKLRVLLFFDHFFPLLPLPDVSRSFKQGNILITDSSFSKDYPYFPLNIKQQFDVIIANPPYMVYGLRAAQKYPKAFKDYLRKRYRSAQYKLPLFSLFMERAIEMLKPSGLMGFITPDSYLLGKYYSKLREYLLNHTRVLNLSLLGFEPFKATLGHTAVSFFQKSQAKERKSNIVITRWINFPDAITLRTWQEYHVNQTDFCATPLKRFYIFFSKEAEDLVKIWHKKNPSKLSDFATMYTGIRSKIGQKRIISLNKKGLTWKKGIISGKQITPFSVKWEGHWINVNPSILWSGGYKKEIIEYPKILLRQTGSNIFAAVDEEGLYHLNNVHSLVLKPDAPLSLYVLCVILNSKDFNRYYHILSLEHNRTFAQIDMDFLLEMHIPMPSLKEQEKFMEFYEKCVVNVQKGKKMTPYFLSDIFQSL